MAFRGLYEHSLDSKDRLTVPSRFRAALSDGVVLSKGFDPCVWVHTTAEFEQLSDRFLSPHSPFGRDARRCAAASTAAPSTRSSTPPGASASPSR